MIGYMHGIGGRACLWFGLGVVVPAGAAWSAKKPVSQPVDSWSRYRQAQEAMEAGRVKQAVELLELLYAEDPSVLGYGLLLAEGYLEQDERAKARSLLGELAARPPGDINAKILLAQMLGKVERWQDVVGVLGPAARGRKGYLVHHLLGESYGKQGRWREALRHYRQAIEAKPGAGGDYQAIGDIHFHEGRHALAAKAYLEAVSRGIVSAELHFALAKAFFALENDLGKVEVRVVKGGQVGQLLEDGYVLSVARGQKEAFHVCPVESAVYQIERSIDLGNKDPGARYLRGTIRLRIGRYAESLSDYKAVEGAIGADRAAEYHAYRSEAHLGLEEYEAYLEHTKRAAKLAPERYGDRIASAYVEVAERYGQRGDLKNYIGYLEQAVKSAPGDPKMHYLLGYGYWDAHDRKRAAKHFRIVLELAPNSPDQGELLELVEQAEKSTE